jgi:dihydrofolate reductase
MMGRIVVNQNVSLDGVVQDPTGEEGFARGGWFLEMTDNDRAEWAKAEQGDAMTTEALLLGRRTDEWFAQRWLGRGGEWADRLNTLPKYVVSATLDQPRWRASAAVKGAVLAGEVVSEVSKLRQEVAGDIVVFGSNPLVRTLIEHDLVDELRLVVFPVVLGSGRRLFGETARPMPLRLVSARPVGDNLTFLTYARDRAA